MLATKLVGQAPASAIARIAPTDGPPAAARRCPLLRYGVAAAFPRGMAASSAANACASVLPLVFTSALALA